MLDVVVGAFGSGGSNMFGGVQTQQVSTGGPFSSPQGAKSVAASGFGGFQQQQQPPAGE